MSGWRKILGLLTPDERRRGLLLVLLMVVNAAVETAGVASVLPFLAVLGNPEMVRSQALLDRIFRGLGFASVEGFLIFLGVLSLVAVLGSAVVRVVTEYGVVRFVEMRRHSLSSQLLKRYLRQPYAFFLNRNSAQLSKSILSEVDHVVGSVFFPALQIPAYGFVTLGLVALLIAVDPAVAVVVAAVVGVSYGGLYLAVTGTIRRRGRDRLVANQARFVTASEVFGGIKEVKLLGREDAYLRRFRDPSLRFSRHQAAVRTLAVVPRYLIEAIGFGGVLALAVSLIAGGDDLGRLLPVLGLYAFAGYRLLPAVQNLYASFTNVRFGLPASEELYDDLHGLAHPTPAAPGGGRVTLERGITLSGVTFRYHGASEPALEAVTLEIPARSIVAFVGETGAGKTTAVDLVLGLLTPTAGEVRIDGVPLEPGRLRGWQDAIGYVPQQIYLADDTVLANVALGVPSADIEREAVENAAKLAKLHDFIVRELPNGYDTVVGERGVRLSGGQRQRLGIARALYNDPAVLVFDEATSAVDTLTEQEVMAALHGLVPDRTIILVAHRLSTVRGADRIFLLDRGRLVAEGRFHELVAASARFRDMAAAVGIPEVPTERQHAGPGSGAVPGAGPRESPRV